MLNQADYAVNARISSIALRLELGRKDLLHVTNDNGGLRALPVQYWLTPYCEANLSWNKY